MKYLFDRRRSSRRQVHSSAAVFLAVLVGISIGCSRVQTTDETLTAPTGNPLSPTPTLMALVEEPTATVQVPQATSEQAIPDNPDTGWIASRPVPCGGHDRARPDSIP